MSHHVPVDKFHVCLYYFDYCVSVWNHNTCFDILKDICKLKRSYFFGCLQRSYVQVCYECLYTKLITRKLDMTSVNSILNKCCFKFHTDLEISKWTNKTVNCHQSFERWTLFLTHRDVCRFFWVDCIKVFVFRIIYFDFFTLDKA